MINHCPEPPQNKLISFVYVCSMIKILTIDEIIEITQKKFEIEFQRLPEGMDKKFCTYFHEQYSMFNQNPDIHIKYMSDDYKLLPFVIRSFFENEYLKNNAKRVGN